LSHPDLSENCQSRIVYDVGDSVNVCDLENQWRRDSQDIQASYRWQIGPPLSPWGL
jgi:hypothetical protein